MCKRINMRPLLVGAVIAAMVGGTTAAVANHRETVSALTLTDSYTGTFTAQDQASPALLVRSGESYNVVIAHTGITAISVSLERSVGNGAAWSLIKSYTAAVTDTVVAKSEMAVRVRAAAIVTNDTISYTVGTANDSRVIKEYFNANGVSVLKVSDRGILTPRLDATAVVGRVTGLADSATGAFRAQKLTTARTINGTSFDGTGNITVTAAAGTLTGTTLNSTVVTSSLTSVGTLAGVTVNGLIDASGASGGQLKFPASAHASADANTLDDYKEGTFTPSLTNLTVVNGTGGMTATGFYTKIGRVVYVNIAIAVTGTATTASTANSTTITNLPYTVALQSPLMASDGNIANIGVGLFYSGTTAYLPSWTARNTTVWISGFYYI